MGFVGVMSDFMEGGERMMPKKRSAINKRFPTKSKSAGKKRREGLSPRYNYAADFDFNLGF